MKIQTTPQDKIEVKIEEVTFIFRASVEQDMPFASVLIQQANGEIGTVDRGVATKHVFKALQEIQGEVTTESGDILTVEKFKELAESGKLQSAFSMQITVPWAIKILGAQGFLKLEPQNKAKEESN